VKRKLRVDLLPRIRRQPTLIRVYATPRVVLVLAAPPHPRASFGRRTDRTAFVNRDHSLVSRSRCDRPAAVIT
jgi:hypothetical protein